MKIWRRLILFIIIPVLWLNSGCSKDEFANEGVVETLQPITISGVDLCMEEDWETTKASSLDELTLSDFGLYAGLAKNSRFGVNTPGADYMENAMVTKDWTLGTWSTQVKYYWPLKGNGTISFFPYAPYINDSAVLQLASTPLTGEPVLLYTPASSASQQKDLCIAPALYDKTVDNNPLSVHFNHALTYIQFWANYKAGTSGLPSGVFIKIDRVTLHNVIGTKGVTWMRTDPYFVWDEDSEDDITDYSLSRSGEELTDNQVPSEPDALHLEYSRGMLYLLPQTINEPEQSEKSTLEIDFSFYRMDGSAEVLISSFNVMKELPSGTVWAPCSVVRYFFTLNVENLSEVEIIASTDTWITDWQPSGNTDPDVIFEK